MEDIDTAPRRAAQRCPVSFTPNKMRGFFFFKMIICRRPIPSACAYSAEYSILFKNRPKMITANSIEMAAF